MFALNLAGFMVEVLAPIYKLWCCVCFYISFASKWTANKVSGVIEDKLFLSDKTIHYAHSGIHFHKSSF